MFTYSYLWVWLAQISNVLLIEIWTGSLQVHISGVTRNLGKLVSKKICPSLENKPPRKLPVWKLGSKYIERFYLRDDRLATNDF